MKQLFVVFLVVSAAFAMHLPAFLNKFRQDPAVDQFAIWVKKYQRVYGTLEEYEHRFNVFKNNLNLIKWIQSGDDSAVYGASQFADLTPEEFAKQYLTFRAPYMPSDAERVKPKVNDLPDSWDWRKYNAVTPVKSQGACGSCWAFSAAGNLEGQLAKERSKLVNISTQQMVDCDTIDSGCNGGFMEWAFQYINQTGGIMTNEDYPYRGVEGSCKFDRDKVVLQVSNYTFFSKNETEIAAAVVGTGPLAVALNASFLQFYLFGIFDPPWCSSELNHGVLTVGYGEAKKPYWIIKNSWGRGFGEEGYFRMVRGKGKCGIDQYSISAIIA